MDYLYENCCFFLSLHTAEYANHFSLKQAWSFHSPPIDACFLCFTERPSEAHVTSLSRWLGQTQNDKPRFHWCLKHDFTNCWETIWIFNLFYTRARTLRRLSSSKAQQNFETLHATSLQHLFSNPNPKINVTTVAINGNMMKQTL